MKCLQSTWLFCPINEGHMVTENWTMPFVEWHATYEIRNPIWNTTLISPSHSALPHTNIYDQHNILCVLYDWDMWPVFIAYFLARSSYCTILNRHTASHLCCSGLCRLWVSTPSRAALGTGSEVKCCLPQDLIVANIKTYFLIFTPLIECIKTIL